MKTVIQALKDETIYPIPLGKIENIAIKRGVDGNDEYDKAMSSVNTAFYTPPIVIKSIYKALENMGLQKGNILDRKTKPPSRFTPATLIQGMKDIHKYVKNPEAKKQLKDVYGIGTEATRATIIEDLIKRHFLITRGKKKVLEPTAQAYLLIDALPDQMTYPDETAVWEDKLHSMSEGDGTLEDFLTGQVQFTRELCEKAKDCQIKAADPQEVVSDDEGEKIICPLCKVGHLKKRMGRSGEFWGCTNYPACKMTLSDKDGKPDL